MPKSKTRNRCKATLIAAAIAALPLAADAAGLGKITVLSALGQPLKAELEVTATRDELASLSAKIAAADAFRQAGIDYAPALSGINFSREVKERGGRRYIEVSTDRPLNEPFVDMLVELSWASGRLVREYTFLLDPPELTQKVPAPAVTVPETTAAAAAAPAATTAAASVSGGDTRPAVTKPAVAEKAPSTKPVAEKPAKTASVDKPAVTTRAVAEGDTLGKIAAQTKPAGVSLDQMLVALFRSNAEAFDGGNMNRLRAGKILNVPDAQAVSAIAADEAHKEVLAQSADFNAYRKKLASAAAAQPAKTEVASQSSGGKIAPKVEDKAPAAPGKDKLQVSRTESGKDASKQAQGRVTALEEEAIAREKALKEANSRVAALEKNLAEMKKLAEMKSQAGADLQKQAQAAKPAAETKKPEPAPAPAQAPAPKPAEPAKPAEAPKAEAAKPADAKPAEAPKAADAAASDKPAEAPKPPVPPKKKPLPPPPPPEPDFMEENGMLVAGGGGILALLLGFLGLRAYRRRKAVAVVPDVAAIAPTDLSTHSVFAAVNPETPAASEHEPSQFSVSTMAGTAQPKTVDPVVEAETFLAFGRDAQAEEILLDAMKAEPERHAIPLKLLEIYSARKSVAQFESVAKELHGQTGGSGPDWEKAAAMGVALDPENSLYGTGAPDFSATLVLSPAAASAVNGQDETPADAAVVDVDVAAAPEDTKPAAEEAVSLDFDLDLDLGDGSAAKAEPEPEVPAAQEAVALDFDLDLGNAPAAEPAAKEEAVKDAAENASQDAVALDFDLDTKEAAPAEEASAAAPEVAPAADSVSIDFDLDAAPAEAAAEVSVPIDAAPALDIALDLPAVSTETTAVSADSLSLDVSLDEVALPEVEVPAVQEPDVKADANSIDFDFELTTPPAEATAEKLPEVSLELPAVEAAAPALDLDGISLELDVPVDAAPVAAPVAVEDNPEVATKIELAMAYEEMGDRDGARELLQEALAEGSPAQQETARAKLEAIG